MEIDPDLNSSVHQDCFAGGIFSVEQLWNNLPSKHLPVSKSTIETLEKGVKNIQN